MVHRGKAAKGVVAALVEPEPPKSAHISHIEETQSLDDQLLRSAMASHDSWFCRLIDCIPKDIYRPVEEDEEYLSTKYYKHKRAPLAADERKIHRKQNRSEKYGLSQTSSSAENDGDSASENSDENSGADDDNSDEVSDEESGDDAVTKHSGKSNIDGDSIKILPNDDGQLGAIEGIEMLKRRLQQKIEQLKSSRSSLKQPRIEGGDAVLRPIEKPARITAAVKPLEASRAANAEVLSDMLKAGVNDAEDGFSSGSEVDDVGDVAFSGLIMQSDTNGEGSLVNQNKPGSKMKRLRQMMEDAQKKRQRIDELKANGADGENKAKDELWNDVLQEASGTKILTNTKRIVKAIKRKEKQKQKSAAEWQTRISSLDLQKSERIQKREQNIKARKLGIPVNSPAETAADVDSKATRTGGRAGSQYSNNSLGKKVSTTNSQKNNKSNEQPQNRAGFEGKKTGFLNASVSKKL